MSEVILFNYLYRDSGNYKKFGSKKFVNPDQLLYEEIVQSILENLIDRMYFYPEQIGIRKFKIHRFWDDYSLYEFESVEILNNTNCSSKDLESITLLIHKLEKMNAIIY